MSNLESNDTDDKDDLRNEDDYDYKYYEIKDTVNNASKLNDIALVNINKNNIFKSTGSEYYRCGFSESSKEYGRNIFKNANNMKRNSNNNRISNFLRDDLYDDDDETSDELDDIDDRNSYHNSFNNYCSDVQDDHHQENMQTSDNQEFMNARIAPIVSSTIDSRKRTKGVKKNNSKTRIKTGESIKKHKNTTSEKKLLNLNIKDRQLLIL